MVEAGSPLWRKVFDGVERTVGRPLESVTASPDFRKAALTIRGVRRAVVRPIESVSGWGAHMIGLPSKADVRELRAQLTDVQRELLAMRRKQIQAEREQQESE